MTGRMVWEQAAQLLGYTGVDGALSGRDELLPRALAVVNQIYSDLWRTAGGRADKARSTDELPRLRSLDEELELTERAAFDVMPWGVAMLLAQSESSGDDQALMTMTYNAKRASLSRIDRREDVFPREVL